MNKRELNKYAERVKMGDIDAFAVIYEETRKGVFSYIYAYVHDQNTALDLMQDTYVKIQLNINSYASGTNFVAWMLQIAKNTSLNFINKRKRETISSDDMFLSIPEKEKVIDEDTPMLDAAKAVLNKDELSILILHAVSGFKHREIAKMLNKPLGTVTWTYKNSIGKIQKYLKKEKNL